MEKFWIWMEKKGYVVKVTKLENIPNFDYEMLGVKRGETIKPTKQMLIGYMMEYCFDKGIEFNIRDFNVYKILEEAIINAPEE